MTISFVAAASVENHTAWPNTLIPRPAGLEQADYLVALIAIIGQPTITGEPIGWTQLGVRDAGSNLRTALYVRTASSSEPPGGYQWSWSQSYKNFGVIVAYRGVDADAPFAEFASAESDPGAGHDTPLAFVPSGGWLLSLIAARHQGEQRTWTISTGDPERYDQGSDAASGQNITGAVYDSGGAIVAAGDYQRTLTASADVVLTAVWSLALRSPVPAGDNLPWVTGVPVGQEGEAPEGIAFVGQADTLNDEFSATTTTVDVPDGVQEGDWMIAHMAVTAASAGLTTPTGWTQVGATREDGNLTTAVFKRKATGAEPGDYTWEHVSTRSAGRIVAYRGGDTTDIVADHAADGTTTSTTTFAMPTVAVPEDGWLVYFAGDRRNSPSDPQVWSTDDVADSKRGEVSGATGSNFQASSAAFDSDRALSASSPARTLTAAQTWGQVGVWAVALTPAS